MCLWRIRVAASKSYIRGKKKHSQTNKRKKSLKAICLKELSVDWYSKSSKELLKQRQNEVVHTCI